MIFLNSVKSVTMFYLIIVSVFLKFTVVCANEVYHVKSKITLWPDSFSEYFGYSVVLRNSSLLVGAPKATSRLKNSTTPGLVFNCGLGNLDNNNITCYPLGMDGSSRDVSLRRIVNVKDFFRNDMWFGATIATMPNEKFLVCAPRWADLYKDKHLLANGACYVQTRNRGVTLTPLDDMYRLAFKTNGLRKEYGEYGAHLNFYAYGQVGISVKVTDMNSIIIGAPGLMQWTGGIVDYRFSSDPNSVFFSKQQVANTYFTKELGPDDYFGYSVESGIFEINGSTLYIAGAPRSKKGYGQVLVFTPKINEFETLKIKAKIRGPQLGSYFGASLCCTDLNGDGRSDLLVGAPNFIRNDGSLPYDQGAVFVYLATGEGNNFTLEEADSVTGSEESGARFGTAIAALGDIDGDGYNDVAIGAPWENDGLGAVYIYKGSARGLKSQYVQRIIAENARSFGISISKGIDIDTNNCSDLAIGAHASGTAYIYRCTPTIQVHAAIKVPDAMNLPQNATNFTALFCVSVPMMESWPHVGIDLIAIITIDPAANRALISGDASYTVSAKPGNDVCKEQIVEVKPTADLSEPISMEFQLKPREEIKDNSSVFPQYSARLSEDSTLNSSFHIQLLRDCGDDLICTPWLVMTLDSYNNTYVPGTEDRLGARLIVSNKEEPAYGAKVHLLLPLPPKRVPSSCSLEGLNMTCEVPAPLQRGESVRWDIDLEYTSKAKDAKSLRIVAKLEDVLYRRNISDGADKEVVILVKPLADFSISGKSLPNATISVTRDKFYEAENLSFVHYIEITNLGPSDWYNLRVRIEIPENVTSPNTIEGCNEVEYYFNCSWSIPAKVSLPVVVPIKYDLKRYGRFLEEVLEYNATTIITLLLQRHKKISTISTVLVLDPAPPIWPLILGSIAGLLVLGAIIYGLYKYGFFSRKSRDELKRLQGETRSEQMEDEASSSTFRPQSSLDADESTAELLSDDDSD